MFEALKEAEKAFNNDEVPIGCVIVKDNKITARARNTRKKSKDATSHAEILAIKKACKKIKDWRLDDCELFVTLEPCPMCAGACFNARLKKVFFGAYDKNGGAFGSVQSYDLSKQNVLNHRIEVVGGVCEDECKKLLQNFFKQKRNKS